jgi:hypothetical protein
VLAVLLLLLQFVVVRLASSDVPVRIVLPATIAAIPLVLWPYRGYLGVWVAFVGIAANLAVILANGGLMPIERSTVAEAVGWERAAGYEAGAWIAGTKDVLVADGGGRAAVLGDSIIVRVGSGGMAASPGDLVVWFGLVLVAAEVAWRRLKRAPTRLGGDVTSQ